tara:strand:- start:264 stop:638 length:375 start_codon:yes stop_codon:yes gene_type:complete
MINQLFKRMPTASELEIILNCYKLKGLNDYSTFTYASIIFYDTINELYKINDILLNIYLPCKINYITNLNNKKAITMLRQICKLYDKKICYDIYISNKMKFIKFNIYNPDTTKIFIKKNIIIKF